MADLHPDERAMVAAIAGGNRDAMFALADWLEERGRDEAGMFWRWAHQERYEPFKVSDSEQDWVISTLGAGITPTGPHNGDAPGEVVRSLTAGDISLSGKSRVFRSELSAWLALAAAADAYRPDPWRCPARA